MVLQTERPSMRPVSPEQLKELILGGQIGSRQTVWKRAEQSTFVHAAAVLQVGERSSAGVPWLGPPFSIETPAANSAPAQKSGCASAGRDG